MTHPRAAITTGDGAVGESTRVPVSAIMTTPAIRVTPETPLEALGDLFLEKSISAVPVVDAEGHALGIVSKTDLLRELRMSAGTEEHVPVRQSDEPPLERGMHEERVARSTAGEVMTPVVFSVHADTPIAMAAGLMAWERIHRVPVIDDERRVVGIVSSLDVLEWLALRAGYVMPPPRAPRT